MADSKFLKYQDIDSDGLIDVCDDDLTTPEAPCKGPCVPDPFSIIDDWKTLNIMQPFINTRVCHFQITKVTPYTSTANQNLISSNEDGSLDDQIDQQLKEKFREFEEEAIENLLDFCPLGARLNNVETKNIVANAIEYKKFDLAVNPGSHLKLLYSVPFDVIYNLADAPEATELDEGPEEGVGWEKVTFNAESLMTDVLRVRKALHFYSKMLKVSTAIGEGNAYFVDSNDVPVTLFNLEDYGDPALFSESLMSRIVNDLKRFLAAKNKALPDGGVKGDPFGPIFKEKVTKLQLSFKDKELRVLRVWTRECGNKPTIYNKRSGSLRSLMTFASWKDKTAVNYLINSKQMATALAARVQIPWREFLETYTFPAIKVTQFPVDKTIGSCIGDALANEVKDFGQDVLDEIFGLGDLVAYLYNDTLCRAKLEEVLKDDEEFNKYAPTDPQSPFSQQVSKILARNQKYKKLKADDDVVLRACVSALSPLSNKANSAATTISRGDIPYKPTTPGDAGGNLDGVFLEVLNDMKLCGLLDFMFDAIKCLFGGMTLQDALPIIIKNALDVMGIENFGELFIGLPPEKQAEMDALVKKKIQDKTKRSAIRRAGGTTTDPNPIDPDADFINASVDLPPGKAVVKAAGKVAGGALIFFRPWEDEETIAASRMAENPANLNGYGDAPKAPTIDQVMEKKSGSDRTILSELDSSRQVSNAAPIDTIMTAYIEALLEVYSDNLILILDELNNFPGAPLLRDLMSLTGLICPRPPLFTPGLDAFMKSIDLAFCRRVKEVEIPRINTAALDLKLAFKNMKNGMMRVARFLIGMIILIVVNQLIAKICEILSRAVCKALETTGDILLGLPAALSGQGPGLKEIIRENICGEGVDDQTIDNTLVDMMAAMALGPAAFANRESTIQFANDLSSAVTRQEFSDALLGKPSPEFLEAADQMVEFVHTDFRDALPNKNSIARFAKNIGNFLPLEYREVLSQYSDNARGFDDGMPANPSICSSPEQIMKFRELRCELLGSRVSKKQCEELFCDLRDQNNDDLELVTKILEEGIGEHIGNKIPNLIAEPGCDDGLFPFETPEILDATTGFMGAALDSLEMDYLDDMFGTGFTLFGSGDRNFGFLNMVLCDTNGNPLTNHHRKATNRKAYVNFATNVENGGEQSRGFFKFLQGNAGFDAQEGQYPYYIAEWMKRQFLNAAGETGTFSPGFNKIQAGGKDLKKHMVFSSTNTAVGLKNYSIDLDDLGYANIFGRQGISTFTAPDFGYNTKFGDVDRKIGADIADGILDLVSVAAYGPIAGGFMSVAESPEGSTLKIQRMPRKGDPTNSRAIGPNVAKNTNGADIVLSYKDNAMGTRQGLDFGTNEGGNAWSYGFEMQCYYSDIELLDPKGKGDVLRNRPDDNIRIQIVEKVNFGSKRKYASPFAKQIAAEETKLPPFDFPNWIEGIPIVGWVLESLVNLFLLPFSALISGILNATIYLRTDKILRSRAYEFLSVDDGLDAFSVASDADPNKQKSLDLNDFPNYAKTTISLQPLPPQVYALADLLGVSPTATLKNEYDETMSQFYTDFCSIIGNNNSGWLYGATSDFIQEDDFEYGIVQDGEFIPYDDLDLDEEEMTLGISRNQFRLGEENARVVYLDPTIFGGSYSRPPLHIKPLRYDGWWGMVQAFFPGDTACKPHGKNLIDFDEIKQMINKHYPTLPEDERLYNDLDCVRQVPFDRILPRHAKMSLYTLILASIRIYASTHIMKTCGTFSAIQPKFPDNFSSIYSSYIVERMEKDFKDAQPAFWEAFNVFKDEEFWYGFLEQSVECYDFLVNAGELPTPVGGGYLQRSADTINNLQTNYAYAYRTKDKRTYTDENGVKRKQTVPGLWESKFTGEAGVFETLKKYRERKNFEGIKAVEDQAKLIMQELVNYELTKMGEKFVTNMANSGFAPQIFDLDYWLFENKCVGSSIKVAGPKLIDVPIGLPTKNNPDPFGAGLSFPGPYYTPGGQFRISNDINEKDEFGYGDEYVGYYHIHMDDDGNEVYMAGAIHSDTSHDVIVPVADILQVASVKTDIIRYSPDDPSTKLTELVKTVKSNQPIGDVPNYRSPGTYSASKPFKIEKYISINGSKYDTSVATSIIRGGNAEARISERYPGTLKLIYNEFGSEVGIEGNIGVRHGLQFYYKGQPVTSVEVDALDFKCAQFQPVQPNSKLLLCLLKHLKNDPKYKLLMSYIFSMKKVTASLAIYNDMGFLASVGEVTPGKKDGKRFLATTSRTDTGDWLFWKAASTNLKRDWMNNTDFEVVKMKPGSRAYIKTIETETRIPKSGPVTDKIRETYGLPSFWDDPIKYSSKSFDPEGSGLTGNEGWEHPQDRPSFTPFTLNWDEWDRELLRNCRAAIKKLFRQSYYAADDRPGSREKGQSPAKIKLRNLKARLFPNPGAGFLPWWQRGRLRDNPYDADGNMCDGPDILD